MPQDIMGYLYIQNNPPRGWDPRLYWAWDRPVNVLLVPKIPSAMGSDPGSLLWTFRGTRMSSGSLHHWTLCPCSGGTYGLMCFAQLSGKFKEIMAFQLQWLLSCILGLMNLRPKLPVIMDDFWLIMTRHDYQKNYHNDQSMSK